MRLAIGLVMTLAAFAVAGRRVHYLYGLIGSGQPAPGRLDGIGTRAKDQLREVFGQRKLLQWSVPGVAHFFTFWAFIVLAATILEAYGALFDRDFAIPVIGHWPLLGFLEDFFAVAVLVSHRDVHRDPHRAGAEPQAAPVPLLRVAHRRRLAGPVHDLQRRVDAVPLPRRAGQHRRLPVRRRGVRVAGGGHVAGARSATTPTRRWRRSGILLQIGVVLGFLVLVVYSKHLHIFLAPLNVAHQAASPTRSARCSRCRSTASRSTSRTSTSWTRTRCSAAARSRTSPGRGCSTSRPAPSAAAARTSARPGTPASRCLPSW